MNNYTNLTSMSLEDLARWINKNGLFDGSPWMKWFDKNYCGKCESVKIKHEDAPKILGFELMFGLETECSYCELHKKCKFFPDMEETPDNTDIIEMWLKEIAEE